MDTESKIAGIIVLVVIVLIGGAIFFLTSEENPDEYVYNNFRVFKNPNTVGYTVVAYIGEQPYHLNLRNDPKNTLNITIDENVRNLILLKPITAFTLDPAFNSIPVLGASEMATILGRRLGIYNKQVIGAVTKEPGNTTENATPVIDCQHVTKDMNVVRLQLGDETKVFLEDNCIIVQGTNEWEIVRASDRLIYHILEVF